MGTSAPARPAERRPSAAASAGSGGFRPDIQALRAIAVGAVVLNHLWPHLLTGGYVGVDVFFVISGFLISSHLTREATTTGRIRLAKFYARRARRLLPAALLVLGVSVVASYFFLPYPRWAANAEEIVASATYWENWLLAANSVDYSHANDAASLARHYWSLSVEEQFYLFWPLLLLLLFRIRSPRIRYSAVGLVGAASLVCSVVLTETAKSQAYFVTPTRVWEFVIGAAIAFAGAKAALPRTAAALTSAAGFAAIFAAAVWFGDETAFPGAIALIPALGTGLVIVAGTGRTRQWHSVVSSSPPVQWLGNVSYSLYLWHWPLIVLAPFVLPGLLDAGKPTLPLMLIVLAASLVLAAASKRLVEDPVRTWPRLSGPGLTFAGTVAGMLAVSVAAGVLTWTYDRHVAQAEWEATAHQAGGDCHGAAAVLPQNRCGDPFGPAQTVVMGEANKYHDLPADCAPWSDRHLAGDQRTTTTCDFSGGAPAPTVAWLVGDSHAQHWQAPVLSIARRNHWVLNLGYLGGCPFAKVQSMGYGGHPGQPVDRRCAKWTAEMADAIADSRPTYVFTSFFARHEQVDDRSGRPQLEQYREGLDDYWSKWTFVGARVLVLADPPLNGAVRAPDCVVLNPADPRACAVPRDRAQPPDVLTQVARASRNPGVRLIDLTDYFCDRERCYGTVGGVTVYYDADHLNKEFSLSLEPMIAAAAEVPAG